MVKMRRNLIFWLRLLIARDGRPENRRSDSLTDFWIACQRTISDTKTPGRTCKASVSGLGLSYRPSGHSGRHRPPSCLLYTSDAADDLTRVDLGGRRIIKKKKKK